MKTDNQEFTACPACAFHAGAPMGALGNLEHYRCRACGWEFSRPLDEANAVLEFTNWTGLTLAELAKAGRIGDPRKTAGEAAVAVLGHVNSFDEFDQRQTLIDELTERLQALADS